MVITQVPAQNQKARTAREKIAIAREATNETALLPPCWDEKRRSKSGKITLPGLY